MPRHVRKLLPRRFRNAGATLLTMTLLAGCAAERLSLQPPSGAMLQALSAGASHPCNDTTASVLEALRFEPGQIQSVTYDRQEATDHEGNTMLQGYDAWVTINGEKGYMVVSVRPDCQLSTYYTRGDVRLPPPAAS